MADMWATFGVALLGGFAANSTAFVFGFVKDKLSYRKAILDRTYSDIEGLIVQINTRSSTVWGSVGDPASLDTNAIVGQLHQLAILISVITERERTGKLRLDTHLVNYRQQVSGGDFNVLGRAAEPARMVGISIAGGELTAACRRLQLEKTHIWLW